MMVARTGSTPDETIKSERGRLHQRFSLHHSVRVRAASGGPNFMAMQ